MLIGVTSSHAGRPETLVVSRQGVDRTVTVTPADGRTAHEAGVRAPAGDAPYGVVGVSLGAPDVRAGPVSALSRTGTDLVHFTWASVVGVAHLFSPSATVQRFGQVTSAKAAGRAAADGTRVSSVVGAVQTAEDAVHAGIGDLLIILISINLFVGIFNLFPMLPLDGGHVAIAVYERIRTGRSWRAVPRGRGQAAALHLGDGGVPRGALRHVAPDRHPPSGRQPVRVSPARGPRRGPPGTGRAGRIRACHTPGGA